MALGCPVICSPVASLPEVGGKAAVFAELNAGAYLAAMQTITRDVQLREEVARRGLQQAAQFSWKRCAQETLQIYQEA